MRNRVEIQNIEEMRRQEGIDDVELREQIRTLAIGDLVKITLLSGELPAAGETLLVRITSKTGCAFRGKLTTAPTAPGLSQLRVGSLLTFTADHIHSTPKRQTAHER